MEATDTPYSVVVRLGEEAVMELYPDESVDPTFGKYRSIFHWVVAMAIEQRPMSTQQSKDAASGLNS